MKFASLFTGFNAVLGTVRASKVVTTDSNKDVTGFRNTTQTGRNQWLTEGPSGGHILAGATLAVTAALHAGRTIALDTAAGSICTLPAATGTGNKYRFRVALLATSNSHIIKVANSTDVMRGILCCLDSDLATVNMFGFAAGATADTITLDRTNTGSVTLGEWVECEDVAAGIWQVSGVLSGAAPATPFSATV